MEKKTFLSILIAIVIVLISFAVLIHVPGKTPEALLISLCEAIFTGGIVSIVPQLIDWHSSESDFSKKLYDEFLDILQWSQSIDFEKYPVQEIQDIAYKKCQNLLRIKNKYVFSCNMRRIEHVRNMLFNFINKIKSGDLTVASRILEKDLIPELKEYVEPQA